MLEGICFKVLFDGEAGMPYDTANCFRGLLSGTEVPPSLIFQFRDEGVTVAI